MLYEGREKYIFISYAHEWGQREKVEALINSLENEGYRVWYDNNIHAGIEWPGEIEKHIKGCHVFLALLSKGYHDSPNCKNELILASNHRKYVIPIELEVVWNNSSSGVEYLLGGSNAIKWKGLEPTIAKLSEHRQIGECCNRQYYGGAAKTARANSVTGKPWMIGAAVLAVILALFLGIKLGSGAMNTVSSTSAAAQTKQSSVAQEKQSSAAQAKQSSAAQTTQAVVETMATTQASAPTNRDLLLENPLREAGFKLLSEEKDHDGYTHENVGSMSANTRSDGTKNYVSWDLDGDYTTLSGNVYYRGGSSSNLGAYWLEFYDGDCQIGVSPTVTKNHVSDSFTIDISDVQELVVVPVSNLSGIKGLIGDLRVDAARNANADRMDTVELFQMQPLRESHANLREEKEDASGYIHDMVYSMLANYNKKDRDKLISWKLGGSYSTLSGTIFTTKKYKSAEFWLEIYDGDELIAKTDSITSGQYTTDFNIDISGVDELVIAPVSTISDGSLMIDDLVVEK